MSAKALLPVAIHHHPSLDRRSLSLPSLSCIFSSFKFFLFKPQNSLQTHFLVHPIPQSSALPSNNSTPLATKSVSAKKPGSSDPDLRAVLELATNSELFELEEILFGPSYFSPMLKSISNGVKFDRFMIEEDFEEREQFINVLESRFLYLAADARSTLRGWRPSYRNVLLDVRKVLSIPCSRKLPMEDLEVEIFIHMLQECSRDQKTGAALRIGAAELRSVLLKGSQLVALLKISEMVSSGLSKTMLLEAAKRKIGTEAIKKELAGAAARYLGFRSLASFAGPILWGTLLADIVIQMLGTDYVRILRAIHALAQIRILRRHGLHLDNLTP